MGGYSDGYANFGDLVSVAMADRIATASDVYRAELRNRLAALRRAVFEDGICDHRVLAVIDLLEPIARNEA